MLSYRNSLDWVSFSMMSVSRHRAKRSSAQQKATGFEPGLGVAVPTDGEPILTELTEGERRILTLRPHWIGVIWPILTTVVVIVGLGAGLVNIPEDWPWFIPWIAFALGTLILIRWPLRRVVSWVSSEYVLTSERLIHRYGWLTRRSVEIPLIQIADVLFSQHLLQRLVKVGDVIVESTGGTSFARLASIERPQEVHRAIYDLLEKARAQTNGSSAPGADPIAQIERLAALRERGIITDDDFESARHRLLKKL